MILRTLADHIELKGVNAYKNKTKLVKKAGIYLVKAGQKSWKSNETKYKEQNTWLIKQRKILGITYAAHKATRLTLLDWNSIKYWYGNVLYLKKLLLMIEFTVSWESWIDLAYERNKFKI